MRTKFWLTAFATFTVTTLLSTPALLAAHPATSPADVPVRLAGAQETPAEVFGKLLSDTEREVVGAAEAMPAEKYNFAPTNGNFQGVNTFAQQAKHLASTTYYLFGDFGLTPSSDPRAIDKLTSKDDIVKALKGAYAFAHEAVDTMTAVNAFEELGPPKNWGPGSSWHRPQNTRAGLAIRALDHANDHYGQMVEYLRMNGIIPPASRK